MVKTQLENDLKNVISELDYQATDIVVSISKNPAFGDYSTNVALQLAKQKSGKSKQSPEAIAKKILSNLGNLSYLEKAEVAGGGFINFHLKTTALMKNLHQVCNYSYLVKPEQSSDDTGGIKKEKILVEFGDPNTHKAFHIGHVRNITVGESIARLFGSLGHEIYRANYQGDIGLHVAKALWGAIRLGLPKGKKLSEKAKFLSKAYVAGAKAYEEDPEAKVQIENINKKLYEKNPKISLIWEKTRKWSLEYFDEIYKVLGVKYDGFFFESEVAPIGKKYVQENIGPVFIEDQGAVIFKGEDHGLHNRVFITSEGNPTYEAKEIGVTRAQREVFDYDRAYIVVASEIDEYFKVVLKAIELIFPDLQGKKQNIPHGFVNLSQGKMSSRTGNVVTFDWLYGEVKSRVEKVMKASKDMAKEEKQQIIDIVSIGAIKFAMLKFAPKTDISFDLEKSVALEGDSGPYIQYTYARSKSVLRSASYDYQPEIEPGVLEAEERQLLQKIEHFPSIVFEAASTFSPNLLASYLIDVSRNFNLFYQKYQIIKAEEKSEFRLALTCAVAIILKQGLNLLGIESPERM